MIDYLAQVAEFHGLLGTTALIVLCVTTGYALHNWGP
jgi:hypothetical protein